MTTSVTDFCLQCYELGTLECTFRGYIAPILGFQRLQQFLSCQGLEFDFWSEFRSTFDLGHGSELGHRGAGTVNFSPPSVHQSKTAHSSTSSYTSRCHHQNRHHHNRRNNDFQSKTSIKDCHSSTSSYTSRLWWHLMMTMSFSDDDDELAMKMIMSKRDCQMNKWEKWWWLQKVENKPRLHLLLSL